MAAHRAAQPRPQGGVPISENVVFRDVVIPEVLDLGGEVRASDLGGNALVSFVRLKISRKCHSSPALPLFVFRGKGLGF
jgi:hypothetical protein